MKRWLRRLSIAAAWAFIPLLAWAVVTYHDAAGNSIGGSVILWLDSGNVAVPTSSAKPMPVAASYPTTVWAAPATGSQGASSGTIVTAPGAKVTIICNTTAATGGVLWLNLAGGTASNNTGLPVPPGGGCKILGPTTSSIITGISSSGTVTYTTQKGS